MLAEDGSVADFDRQLWRVGIAAALGFAVVVVVAWGMRTPRGGPPAGDATEAAPASASTPAQPPAPAAAPARAPAHQIDSGGRLALDAAELPASGPLAIGVEMPDDARGSGPRPVRVISTDGRRLDLLADPLPGAGTGLRVEIDPAFLSPGRYLIQVDTADPHPLQLRRYVLEIR